MTGQWKDPGMSPQATDNALPGLAVPGADMLQTLLQNFFRSRGAQIKITEEDACEVVSCWH